MNTLPEFFEWYTTASIRCQGIFSYETCLLISVKVIDLLKLLIKFTFNPIAQ